MFEITGPLAGLSRIAGRYDAIFSDVWGVLHNGVVATPGADEALARYRAEGGRVVLVTNSPRPEVMIVSRLDEMGISRDAYDALVSSGDASRPLVSRYAGGIVHYVGPPAIEDAVFEGLEVRRGPAEEADVVLLTDLETYEDTPEMYEDRMRLWLKRSLPVICANPDKIVEQGDRLVYCGGAVADLYAEAGGQVIMAGKPYAPIYEEALRRAETGTGSRIGRDRILAIGDSARTDATGAARFGADFLFIPGPLHAADFGGEGASPQAVRDLIGPTEARLAGYMPRLAW